MVEDLNKDIEPPLSLKEYYEMFLDGEILNIKYKCYCSKCGFSRKYEKTINIIKQEEI